MKIWRYRYGFLKKASIDFIYYFYIVLGLKFWFYMKNKKNQKNQKQKPFLEDGSPIPMSDHRKRDMFPTAVNLKPKEFKVLRIPGK